MGLRAKEEKEKEETNLGEISRFRTFWGSGEGVGMFKKEKKKQKENKKQKEVRNATLTRTTNPGRGLF